MSNLHERIQEFQRQVYLTGIKFEELNFEALYRIMRRFPTAKQLLDFLQNDERAYSNFCITRQR